MNSYENREIKVFVSSTFNDMNDERDKLVQTFNYIRKEAAKRRVSVIMIDLRWGITEEESSKGQVIDICLKEIQRSKPFFIGVIGDSYGSIPPASLADDPYISESFPGVPDLIRQGLSYTEIEIQYGVLKNPDSIHALFYIKDSQPADTGRCNAKLENLKKSVLGQTRYPVKGYSTPDEMVGHIKDEFIRMLDELYPETDMTEDENLFRQMMIRDNLLDFHYPRQSFTEKFLTLLKGSYRLIHLEGSQWSGKSSFLANLTKNPPVGSLSSWSYYFVGNNNVNEELADVVSYLIGEEVGYDDMVKKVSRHAYKTDEHHYIVIDGADTLRHDHIIQYGMPCITVLPENYTLVVSTNTGSSLNTLLKDLAKETTIELPPFTKDEKTQFIKEYLIRLGKKLEVPQITKIAESPITDSVSTLRCLLEDLSAFGQYTRLDEKISELTETSCTRAFYKKILNRLENDFSKGTVKDIFQTISLSCYGFTEDEIVSLCKIRRYDLSLLISNCPSLLKSNEGFIKISNKVVHDLVLDSLDKSAIADRRKEIAEYFLTICNDYTLSFLQYDPAKINFAYNETARHIMEASHQYLLSGDMQSLHDLLANPSYFEIMFRYDVRHLKTCYEGLLSHGYILEKLTDAIAQNINDAFLKPVILNDLGRLMNNLKQQELAWKYFGMIEENNPKVQSVIINNKAIAASREGRDEEALELFRQALVMKLAVFERNSSEVAYGYSNLGRMHSILKQYQEAIKHLEISVEIFNMISDGANIDTADILYLLASCYSKIDDDSNAYETYKKAYGQYSKLEGDSSESAMNAHYGMGYSLYYMGRISESVNVLNEVLDKYIKTKGEHDRQTKRVYNMLGIVWERISEVLYDSSTKERRMYFYEMSAFYYAHADKNDDAQMMIDKYNSLL